MELTLSLEEHLNRSAQFHRRLCPRQVIGVRMARFACQWFNVDPALKRGQFYIYMETGRCTADGVIAVTNASPMNQMMQLVPYGKLAATFVHLPSRDALRVAENPASRTTAMTFPLPAHVDASTVWEKQLHVYQLMPDDLLLRWQTVKMTAPLPVHAKKHKTVCSRCGDSVHDKQEVCIDGAVLCKACAYGAYYAEV